MLLSFNALRGANLLNLAAALAFGNDCREEITASTKVELYVSKPKTAPIISALMKDWYSSIREALREEIDAVLMLD